MNDLDKMLRTGKSALWRTGKPPKKWAPGDRVFFWSSAPRLELVGLGELLGETGKFSDEGETLYRVRYITDPLSARIHAKVLRSDAVCSAANFLKPAVAQGVLEVTTEQAHQMYRLLDRANGSRLRFWQDIPQADAGMAAASSVDDDHPFGLGQGFGENENNKEIEQAAVKVVSNDYERRGWTVRSTEQEQCGYDLECSRSRTTEYVEVKGIRGTHCSFLITAGELAAANRQPAFVLMAVTDVLRSPAIHRFSADQLQKDFRLDPVAFRAVPMKRK